MAPEQEVEILKGQLSLSSLKVAPAAVGKLPDGQNELVLARIYGNAASIDTKEDKSLGTSQNYFRGTFEGVNMVKGTTQRGSKLILPKSVADVVEKAMKDFKDSSVQFAFEIRSIKTANKGWSYRAVAIKNPAALDELAELRGTVSKYGKTAQAQRAA